MIPIPFNVLGRDPLLGDVSAFRVQITPADIAASTAFHAFNLTASSGCKIRWGDGKQTYWTSNGLYSHTYAIAGLYTIQILGNHTNFNHYSATSNTTPTKVIQAIKLYSGLTSCANAFQGCSNAKFVLHWGFRIGSSVTSCDSMFKNCYGSAFIPPNGFSLGSLVQNCASMFSGCSNANFSLPSTFILPSSVTNLFHMFDGATYFNSSCVTSWNTSNVTTMAYLFANCINFNQDITSWNTAKVTTLDNTFTGARAFNQNISSWNVASVTVMNGLFRGTYAFNQNISSWNVSNVTYMAGMFQYAKVFDQPLNNWNISKVTDMSYFLNGATAFSTANYDALLIGWAAQTVKQNVVLGTRSNLYYTSSAVSARNTLTSTYGWSITDGGLAS